MHRTRRVATAGTLCFIALSIGCIDETRINRECRWTDASSASLNLDHSADREHLRQDAQVAWEVGQRYADIRYRTQPLLARSLLDTCRSAMFDSIISRHAVTRADVDRAVRARQWPVDVITVFVPIIALAILITLLAARELERTMSHNAAPAVTQLLARLLLIIVVALIAAGLMQIWAMSVEAWRLHNEHIAGRAFVIPSVAHPAVAVAVMAIVAATTLALRASRYRSPSDSIS